jgi:hypothetical protein
MLNIESNQETEAERKDRQARAARFFAKHPLRVPAPGAIGERRQGDAGTFDPDSRSRDIDWSQCPNCAKRKSMSRDRKAKQRQKPTKADRQTEGWVGVIRKGHAD